MKSSHTLKEQLTINLQSEETVVIKVTDATVDNDDRWELVTSTADLKNGEAYLIVYTGGTTPYFWVRGLRKTAVAPKQ